MVHRIILDLRQEMMTHRHSALQRLRDTHSQVLWADTICVNQSSVGKQSAGSLGHDLQASPTP